MRGLWLFGAGMVLTMLSAGPLVAGDHANKAVQAYKASTDFEYVRENIHMAITNRGMLVSGTLHVSEMMNRTGSDLGYPENVFLKAESIEFCSALMSHKMISADPTNLVICPFTMAVYVLAAEPDQVYVAYREPALAGDAGEATEAVRAMLDEIAREAAEL